ncbi:hypothetical protein L1987_54385 [Smallanthus sonchifolius]|uniref:Uncharacterized protein n=1 Tax=Smallanthus sonchifolius TaxID=185202 RepID=A0ACB9E6H1_9ASTR|nr:hypothetical protein L1987_54385 [Smallanthus sonchifolius]
MYHPVGPGPEKSVAKGVVGRARCSSCWYPLLLLDIPSFTACGKGIHRSLRKRTFLVFCSKGLVQPGEVQAR